MTGHRYTVTWDDRDTGRPQSITLRAVDTRAAEHRALDVHYAMDTCRNVRVTLAMDEEPVLTQARAERAYLRNLGFHDDPKVDLTDEEQAAVRERWHAMPGHSRWIDALASFVHGDAPPVAGSK